MTTHPLVAWAQEREAIRIKRAGGQPYPWTTDPILLKFRFCNVSREDDAVTEWIRLNWRAPNAEQPDLWFAMVVARHLNLPSTLFYIPFPLPWQPEAFKHAMSERQGQGLKSYNAAYMIRAGRTKPKADYLADEVFTPLWDKRDELRPRLLDTLETFHNRLQAQFGLGSFMAGQIVADMKYSKPLVEAADWWTFAASGPGSRRGLNRALGNPVNSPWNEEGWRLALANFWAEIAPTWPLRRIHMQDLQNCLCEFDKYERVRLGEGRPKRLFKPGVLIHG